MVSLQRGGGSSISKRGGGGSNFFGGGGGGGGRIQMLISIEIHITCDFPGGGPDPRSSLWIRTRDRLTPLLWSIKI